MKSIRQKKIIELIETNDIETQEELAQYLKKAGFQVTQATVSRDIRELQLSKRTVEKGRQKYVFLPESENQGINHYMAILKNGFVSMEMAQNILVIKTVPGMAMAVAAALDQQKYTEIVGSIAGDDTIMCAVKSVEDTRIVMEKIMEIIGKK